MWDNVAYKFVSLQQSCERDIGNNIVCNYMGDRVNTL